ncbi:MAG: 50S ribosomal protein L10 [Thermoleophilaceae bacterium]
MNRDQKAAVIDEVAAEIEGADAIYAVDYRGISVPQAAELRTRLREADASFRIVKNRLTLRAVDKAGAEGLKELLEGPTALTFVRGDAAVAAKAITTFGRQTDLLEIKGGMLGADVLTIDQIKDIARLPGREQLQAQLVGVLASPITGLVRGLGSLISGLAIQLEQIREQGLVGGDAPAPEAEEAPKAEDAPQPEAEAAGDPVAEAEAAESEVETSEDQTPSEGEEKEG